jgi:SAM-dependent methyltransferase
MYPLMQRRDLSHTMESIVGDCCGPGSFFDSVRQYLSTYGFAHYGEFDPKNCDNTLHRPGSLVSLLRQGLGKLDQKITGPVIDMGCSVGRTSFELAQVCDDIVLGVDLNFSMVQTASKIMNTGLLSYPKRTVGMVYEPMEYPVNFPKVTHLDFWVCDAMALPFSDGKFCFALSYNVLDCVTSPYDHLKEIARLLGKNAKAIVSSPYDWTQGATPVEAWIGGHSQRGTTRGSSELLLRSLLSGGEHPNAIQELEIVSEIENFPWELRIHERSTMNYSVHMTMVKKK